MAFPGSGKSSLESAWSRIKSTAGAVKDKSNQLNAAVSVARKEALDYANNLADALALFDSLTATPGLLAYARTQEDNATLDLVAEYTAMRTQIVATQDWLVTNFPKDTSNNLSVYAFDVNKRYSNVNLTAGQLTAFKAQLTALAATIA